ncbi:hypothetical protein JET18_00865 [Chryseobacterium sp. L7]|uniref:Uncharacterized protein n=1 Tax=Chryseobacterium endalhagicum TaxID=2797638 RepID=A0ABS1QBU4_9FLAO|nr:hypothetical protein [Chryseobacterium endalhagicum]MBL1219373.1 hypothetical protein [Chryseobacterium endalhagicum]
MELPMYQALTEFQDCYLDAFEKFPEFTLLEYLREYKKKYELLSHENMTLLSKYGGELMTIANHYNMYGKTLGLTNMLPPYIVNDHGLSLGQIIREIRAGKKFDEEEQNNLTDIFKKYENCRNELGKHVTVNVTLESIIFLINEKIDNAKQAFRETDRKPIYSVQDNPEVDFSDNSDKVKLIMLERLGIINYIKTIQTKPDTISHTSEILSAITGIDSKTLNSYLYPMLKPCRDDDDKNSPYKNPENLEKAERELIKLKIKNIHANH